MDFTDLICPICGQKKYHIHHDGHTICCECISKDKSILFDINEIPTQEELNKLATYILYTKKDLTICRYYYCSNEKYEDIVKNEPWKYIKHISPEEVEAWYPRTFAQKIDKILLYLGSNTKYFGQEFRSNNSWEIKKLFFINDLGFSNETTQELNYFVNYLFEEKYLEGEKRDCFAFKNAGYYCVFTLTPKALARVDELQKNINNNKDIFVAMAFNPNTDSTREAIRAGIKGARFSEKFLDEIIHNQQIVPYMMRLIRDCRFLIMDITEPNYGAYYEAGYALGLGKEVIITCRQDIFSKKIYKDELEEKALKPHFDILQKQILVWKDEKDLSAKLKQWILELATRKR